MLRKILLFITLLPLGLALACGIFDDRQTVPVEGDPENKPRGAGQAQDELRCDAELRRFLTDASHSVVTADGANAAVSYVQSQHDDHCPPSDWNPHVSAVAIDDAGNIDVSFALPAVRTGNNAITTTGEGTLRWVFLVADGHWYAAEPDDPAMLGEDRSENARPTAGMATPAATPEPEQTTKSVTDRDVYEEAWATCKGYYRGVEVTRRKQVARLKSLEGLRDSLRRNCDGAVAAVAAALGVTPAPVPTWPPTATPLPAWAPVPTTTWSLAPTLRPPPMVSRPTPPYSVQPTAPAPTPTPEHAAASNPSRPTGSLQRLMLDLTNERRAAAGVPAVRMGNNRAAQLHAQAALEGCYSGHWDRWGLKPNHRYTLAGGTGADAENMSGSSYCTQASDNYATIRSMEDEVRKTVQGWMDSPGHRRALLDPAYTILNVGIANDGYSTTMTQHFSTDYVRFSQRPTISNDGTLTFSAKVVRATLDIGNSVNVQIAYDRPPKPLTLGQLAHTYALCNPTPVAYVVKPLPEGSHYTGDGTRQQTVQRKCVDPYLTSSGRAAPASAEEAHQAWAAAKSASANAPDVTITTSRIIAEAMTVSANSITVQADIGRILDHYGPGIYTVLLWGHPDHMSARTPLSKQAIFWKTRPPSGAPY